MISVEDALSQLFALVSPLGIETVPLIEATGRVLARDVSANRDQPPFASSAMDGYAVIGAETDLHAQFKVIGESAAGHRFDGIVKPGQAVRIFTGAPVPEGASHVVIQEDVERRGDLITIVAEQSQDNIRPLGTDFRAGETVRAPRLLAPEDIALLAAMNIAHVPVHRRPVVALISTGDELVMPGETPGPDQIIASNTFGLHGMAAALGADPRVLPIAHDNRESLETTFRLAEDADLIVTIGGASVGDHDLVGDVAEALGLKRAFYKIAMRPGKPLMAGRMGNAVMLGLPGNPVSAMVCGHVFLAPLIRALLGLAAAPAPRKTARLTGPLGANGPREHYQRAHVADGRITVFDRQDSSLLSILAQSNALAISPPGAPEYPANSEISYIPLRLFAMLQFAAARRAGIESSARQALRARPMIEVFHAALQYPNRTANSRLPHNRKQQVPRGHDCLQSSMNMPSFPTWCPTFSTFAPIQPHFLQLKFRLTIRRNPMVHFMRKWVTVGTLSLQASLSLAAELPNPVTHSDASQPSFSTILLGRDLFFDPVLSGNRNIACATCHHVSLGSTDGVALGVGEGGTGLGRARQEQPDNDARAVIPRNAPALFNLGASGFTTLYHDGRVAADPDARMGFALPEGAALERPLPNTLAAQALMPLISPKQMAGSPGENAIADLVAAGDIRGPNGAWQKLAERVESIPSYSRRFDAIIGPEEPLHITDIASAIAGFIAFEFASIDSPFDAYLSGRTHALTPRQKRGLHLFYGKAGCSTCHSGPYLTDHAFHAIGMPQIGPGMGHGAPFADHGRAAVTGDPRDLYRFRTPALRNVALTAPYGHSGAYMTLEEVVRHHLSPRDSLLAYDPRDRSDGTSPPTPDAEEIARIAAAIDLAPVALSEPEIADILSFLEALTDPHAATGRLGAPALVPSGLAIDKLTLH